jgi:hypothetical protein
LGISDDGLGSFDIVEENLWRFIKLYPDYLQRGLSVTTTANTDFRKTNDFLKDFSLYYPSMVINSVNSFLGVNHVMDTVACERTGCGCLESDVRNEVPDFLDWTNEQIEKLHACLSDYKTTLLCSWERGASE